MIKVTEKQRQSFELMKEDGKNPFIRVGVKGGGCSGLMYEQSLIILNENDKSFVDNGVMVVVDKKAFYLVGTV